MLYKHKCSSVLRCALHVIHINVETVTLDVGGSTESVFTSCPCKYEVKRCLQKRSYNSTSLQVKLTMSDDFELRGEDEMEPTSSVTFSTSSRIT